MGISAALLLTPLFRLSSISSMGEKRNTYRILMGRPEVAAVPRDLVPPPPIKEARRKENSRKTKT
jgi:hypothetical protein